MRDVRKELGTRNKPVNLSLTQLQRTQRNWHKRQMDTERMVEQIKHCYGSEEETKYLIDFDRVNMMRLIICPQIHLKKARLPSRECVCGHYFEKKSSLWEMFQDNVITLSEDRGLKERVL